MAQAEAESGTVVVGRVAPLVCYQRSQSWGWMGFLTGSSPADVFATDHNHEWTNNIFSFVLHVTIWGSNEKFKVIGSGTRMKRNR